MRAQSPQWHCGIYRCITYIITYNVGDVLAVQEQNPTIYDTQEKNTTVT